MPPRRGPGFEGLSDIIINNWSEFQDLIPSQHWLKQRLDELERARNFVAHHRMLSEPEFARLEMYVTEPLTERSDLRAGGSRPLLGAAPYCRYRGQ
jgi:hypothetical protein